MLRITFLTVLIACRFFTMAQNSTNEGLSDEDLFESFLHFYIDDTVLPRGYYSRRATTSTKSNLQNRIYKTANYTKKLQYSTVSLLHKFMPPKKKFILVTPRNLLGSKLSAFSATNFRKMFATATTRRNGVTSKLPWNSIRKNNLTRLRNNVNLMQQKLATNNINIKMPLNKNSWNKTTNRKLNVSKSVITLIKVTRSVPIRTNNYPKATINIQKTAFVGNMRTISNSSHFNLTTQTPMRLKSPSKTLSTTNLLEPTKANLENSKYFSVNKQSIFYNLKHNLTQQKSDMPKSPISHLLSNKKITTAPLVIIYSKKNVSSTAKSNIPLNSSTLLTNGQLFKNVSNIIESSINKLNQSKLLGKQKIVILFQNQNLNKPRYTTLTVRPTKSRTIQKTNTEITLNYRKPQTRYTLAKEPDYKKFPYLPWIDGNSRYNWITTPTFRYIETTRTNFDYIRNWRRRTQNIFDYVRPIVRKLTTIKMRNTPKSKTVGSLATTNSKTTKSAITNSKSTKKRSTFLTTLPTKFSTEFLTSTELADKTSLENLNEYEPSISNIFSNLNDKNPFWIDFLITTKVFKTSTSTTSSPRYTAQKTTKTTLALTTANIFSTQMPSPEPDYSDIESTPLTTKQMRPTTKSPIKTTAKTLKTSTVSKLPTKQTQTTTTQRITTNTRKTSTAISDETEPPISSTTEEASLNTDEEITSTTGETFKTSKIPTTNKDEETTTEIDESDETTLSMTSFVTNTMSSVKETSSTFAITSTPSILLTTEIENTDSSSEKVVTNEPTEASDIATTETEFTVPIIRTTQYTPSPTVLFKTTPSTELVSTLTTKGYSDNEVLNFYGINNTEMTNTIVSDVQTSTLELQTTTIKSKATTVEMKTTVAEIKTTTIEIKTTAMEMKTTTVATKTTEFQFSDQDVIQFYGIETQNVTQKPLPTATDKLTTEITATTVFIFSDQDIVQFYGLENLNAAPKTTTPFESKTKTTLPTVKITTKSNEVTTDDIDLTNDNISEEPTSTANVMTSPKTSSLDDNDVLQFYGLDKSSTTIKSDIISTASSSLNTSPSSMVNISPSEVDTLNFYGVSIYNIYNNVSPKNEQTLKITTATQPEQETDEQLDETTVSVIDSPQSSDTQNFYGIELIMKKSETTSNVKTENVVTTSTETQTEGATEKIVEETEIIEL